MIVNERTREMTAAIAVPSPKSAILGKNPFSRKDPASNFLGRPLKGFGFHPKPRTKHDSLSLIVASATPSSSSDANAGERFYFNFTGFPFPLGPFLNRRTIRTEVNLNHFPFLLFLIMGLFDSIGICCKFVRSI